MRTVKPIQPIRAVRAIGRIILRPAPTMAQLRMWLVFARQKARERGVRPPASRQAAVTEPEASAHGGGDEGANVAADHGHIDKRV